MKKDEMISKLDEALSLIQSVSMDSSVDYDSAVYGLLFTAGLSVESAIRRLNK